MSKILLTVVVAIFFSLNNLSAQESKLYLIAGQGYPGNCKATDLEYDKTFPVHLFALTNDSLKLYFTLASTQNVNRIALFNSYNMAVVYKSEVSIRESKFTIIKINYGDGLRLDSIVKTFPVKAFFDNNFYLVDLVDPWIAIKYRPSFDTDSLFYYGLNLNSGKDSLFNNQLIRYLHSEGEQGCAVSNNTDIIKLGTKLKKGNPIYYIKEPRLFNKDTCEIIIPKIEQLKSNFKYITSVDNDPNQFRPIPIYNRKSKLLITNGTWNATKLLGTRNFEFFTSHDSTWRTITIPGSYIDHGLRQFGNWLSGYISYVYDTHYNKLMAKNGSIPGKKYRSKVSMYGMSFDERAYYIKIFPEGKLFLYNNDTNKYFEWEALENGQHQGDSEILLVKNNVVYYRINDKIYRAQIINGEKLGTPKLLVKDPRVPDIHWAFISGS